MRCDQVREALSARLDGEDSGDEGARADAHLADCAGCRSWFDAAAQVTRLARTSAAIEPADESELTAALAVAPGPGWARTGRLLRVLLGLLGFAQFVLGVTQIASLGVHTGFGSADGMSSDHLLHESAAWNVAIGAGYLWIALRRARPAGMLPILTAFVGVLVLLSISDLVTGEVVASTLLMHTFVALGYVVLLLLRHPGFDVVTPPGKRRWRLRYDDDRLSQPVDRPITTPVAAPAPRRAHGATASGRRRVA
ncbi:MAG TPA: zf-HC2 domain-containing protein [Micromonosporaceae bacterium]|jgi:predicted anti-sigma-YlaC factor YlaD